MTGLGLVDTTLSSAVVAQVTEVRMLCAVGADCVRPLRILPLFMYLVAVIASTDATLTEVCTWH